MHPLLIEEVMLMVYMIDPTMATGVTSAHALSKCSVQDSFLMYQLLMGNLKHIAGSAGSPFNVPVWL